MKMAPLMLGGALVLATSLSIGHPVWANPVPADPQPAKSGKSVKAEKQKTSAKAVKQKKSAQADKGMTTAGKPSQTPVASMMAAKPEEKPAQPPVTAPVAQVAAPVVSPPVLVAPALPLKGDQPVLEPPAKADVSAPDKAPTPARPRAQAGVEVKAPSGKGVEPVPGAVGYVAALTPPIIVAHAANPYMTAQQVNDPMKDLSNLFGGSAQPAQSTPWDAGLTDLASLAKGLKFEMPVIQPMSLEDFSLLPKIKTVYPTGEKPLVILTFKCPTELVGITTLPVQLLRDLITFGMDGINSTNLLDFNMQQVCQ